MHNAHRVAAICNHLFPQQHHHFTQPSTASPSSPETHSSLQNYQVIIVGGGVAGAALAAALGLRGKRVLCVERDLSTPDRIVGELLQPGGMRKLRDLGLYHCTEGIDACDIHGYSVFLNDERVRVPYTEHALGRAFHHGRFVDRLRDAAHRCPSVDLVQGTVTGLLQASDDGRVQGIQFRRSGSKEVQEERAPLTVVCDGSGSFFRRHVRSAGTTADVSEAAAAAAAAATVDMQTRSHFVAVLLKNAGHKLPYPGHGHVILADPSPVLSYPISASGDVRVLVDMPAGKIPAVRTGEMATYLLDHVAPQLPTELKEPFREAVAEGEIRMVPNRELAGQAQRVNGAILLGDAFNCRHPLTGGGMTVALSDCVIIRDILCDEVPDISEPHRLSQALSTFYERRKPMAATINILAGALYSVFAQGNNVDEMRRACFEYFKLGGPAVAGPISLISGVSPRPYELLAHFFAVAVFGAGRMVLSNPLHVPRAIRMVKAAAGIVRPLMYQEKVLCWLPEFGLAQLPESSTKQN